MQHGIVIRVLLAIIWFWVVYPSGGVAIGAFILESSFNVAQTFTDNLFFDDNNKQSDFGTAFGPNFLLKYENPDIVIGATYLGRFAVLYRNPDESQFIQNANILLDLPFLTKGYKNLKVTVQETMFFTPQLDAFGLSGAQDEATRFNPRPGFDQSQEQEDTAFASGVGGNQGVFTTRSNSFINTAGLTIEYQWTPRLSPSVSYVNQYLHFFSSEDDLQDSLAHNIVLRVPYLEQEGFTVAPVYSYRLINFIGTTETTQGDKIIIHEPQLEITYPPTPSIRTILRGGVAFVKEKGVEDLGNELSDKWQANLVGFAGIIKRFRNGSLGLDVEQTIGGGGGVASQATRTRVITGRIQRNIAGRLNAFGSVGYATNSSTEGNALDTNTYRIQSGLLYIFKSWLTGSLTYAHTNQRSDGPAADDITVNQVFLGLSAFADP